MNFDDRARQITAYNEHKAPNAAARPASISGILEARTAGVRRRWILCDAETGYPISQLKAEPVGAPWEKRSMAVELARSPANAAVAFLEAAGLYLALCCDGPPLCAECAKLADQQAEEAMP